MAQDYGYDENGELYINPPPVPTAPAAQVPRMTYEQFSRALMDPQPISEPTSIPPGPAPFSPSQQPFVAQPQVTHSRSVGPQGAVSTTQSRMPSTEEQASARIRIAQAQQAEHQMSEAGRFDTNYDKALEHFGTLRKNLAQIKSAPGIGGDQADPNYLKRNLTQAMTDLIPFVEQVAQAIPKTRTEAMGGPGQIFELPGRGGQRSMESIYGKRPGGYETDASGKHILLSNIGQQGTPATQQFDPVRTERTRHLVDNAGSTLVGLAVQAFPQLNISGDTNKKLVPLESLDPDTLRNVSMVMKALEGWMDKGMFTPGRQKQMAGFIERFSKGGVKLKWNPPGYKEEQAPTGAPTVQPPVDMPYSPFRPTKQWFKKYFGDTPGAYEGYGETDEDEEELDRSSMVY